MKVAQCVIDNGNKHLVCWLDRMDELKPGVQVTLKDSEEPETVWTVRSVGQAREKDEIAAKRSGTWFNTDFVRKGPGWGNASGN